MDAFSSLSEKSEDDYKIQASRMKGMAKGKGQGVGPPSLPLLAYEARRVKSPEGSDMLLLKAKLRPLHLCP